MSKSFRGLASSALVVAMGWISTPARGDAPVDVVVTNQGASPLKVRVTEGGRTIGASHELWVGTLGVESSFTMKTSQRCVWVEQTLVDANGPWSDAQKFCRPEKCQGIGRSFSCEPIEGAPMKIDVDGTP